MYKQEFTLASSSISLSNAEKYCSAGAHDMKIGCSVLHVRWASTWQKAEIFEKSFYLTSLDVWNNFFVNVNHVSFVNNV